MRNVQVIGKPTGVYLYLRKAGLPSVALSSPLPPPGQELGSPLEAEVKTLITALTGAKPAPSTLGEALRAYELEDAGFKALMESTKKEYRYVLREFDETLGKVRLAAFTPAYVLELRDAWAQRGHRCANVRRTILGNVLRRSVIGGQLDRDPFDVVGPAKRPAQLGEPHVIWPDTVLRLFLDETARTERHGLARAIAITRYAGPRIGDVVRLAKTVREGGRIRFLSGKKRVPVNIEEDSRLTAELARIPDRQPDKPRRGRRLPEGVASAPPSTLVFTVTNRRYLTRDLEKELRKVRQTLQKRGVIDDVAYDFHGLRHTRGCELARAGCSDAEIAAQLGHGNPASARQYRRQADRIHLADSGAEKVRNMRRTEGVKAHGK